MPTTFTERGYGGPRTSPPDRSGPAESAGDLPAWLLLTSAGLVRIKTIAKFYSFVELVTGDGHILLVAPESVSVMMKRLLPGSDEPRFPIGFAPPDVQDVVLTPDASD